MNSLSTTAEARCQWHFISRHENDSDIGPNEPMQENFRKTPYASLIREAIQNSLDVCDPASSEPVTVSFSIGSVNSKNYPELFNIRAHIQACMDYFSTNDKAQKIYSAMLRYLDKVNQLGGKMHYIRVSDHNTVGMNYDNQKNNDSPFYAFVRSAGVSSKADASAGGSFGFGKAAYFYLSAIRTILVSTKTTKGDYYFEGVASLCSHKMNEEKVSPIIYYDSNEGRPITEYENIPNKFKRKDKDGNEYGAGTDIFIMGIDYEEQLNIDDIYQEMRDATLENFWLAIWEKKLIVEIDGDTISADNLSQLMEKYYDEHDENKKKNYNPRPYFTAVRDAGSSEQFILRTINLNEIESLVRLRNTDWGEVHYYFAKNKKAPNRIVYMRSLRMFVNITAGRNGEGYYGVIVCPNGFCNEVLRSIEDPAHREWKPSRVENKEDKKIAKTLLEVIENKRGEIIRDIFKLDEAETIKIKGLEQYLYIPTEADKDNEEDVWTSEENDSNEQSVDKGFSPTTVGDEFRQHNNSQTKKVLGAVLKKERGIIRPDSHGTVLTGRGSGKIKNPHTNDYISAAKPMQRNIPTEGEAEGHYYQPVIVRYRSFARSIGNEIKHKLIVYCDDDIENGQIDLLVGGEDTDSKLSLSYVSEGEIKDNSIYNLHLHKGRNELDFCFADNLRHAVKLEVYEIK